MKPEQPEQPGQPLMLAQRVQLPLVWISMYSALNPDGVAWMLANTHRFCLAAKHSSIKVENR